MTSYDGQPAVSLADSLWDAAVAALTGARTATLICHVSPDADAIGSMLALARVLRSRGTTVTPTWGDEHWQLPSGLAWLPDVDTCVLPGSVPETADVVVVLDTASRERLGVLAHVADEAPCLVVVDHHAQQSTPVGGIALVDPAAAATAVVVEELIRRLGAEPDSATATLLYAGLVTDTGSFAHPVTTPAVHAVAGRLLAAGARPDEAAQQLWGTRSFAFTRLLGNALSRAQLDVGAAAGHGIVWTSTTLADLDGGVELDELDHVMEALRRTAEADVAVLVKEHPDRSWRVSTRSRGATDVGAACAALGGGGHRLAAGFTSYDEPPATIARFATALAGG